MELIRTYAGFAMAASIALLLLPEGSLRKTAALAVGLLSTLLWLRGLESLPALPAVSAPASVLTETGFYADTAAADAYAHALSLAATQAAGCPVAVQTDAAGQIVGLDVDSDDPAAHARAAAVLGLEASADAPTEAR